MLPLISVVVCTFNRSVLLESCLKSLSKQSLDRNLFEILVIDNNSTDDTKDIVNNCVYHTKNVSYFIEYTQGLSHARNRGYKEAKGHYVAYIDDDAIADKYWCEKILKAFETVSPKPVAVGGRILPYYPESKPDWFLDEFEIREWGEKQKFLKPPRARFGFSGANMSFQKSVLEKYRGFSTNFGMVDGNLRMGEDTEFFYRLYPENPYFWYDPSIIVSHYTPIRNTYFSYKFKRSFNTGFSQALFLQGKKAIKLNFFIYSLFSSIVMLIKDFALRLFEVISGDSYWKTNIFKFLGNSGYRLGYFKGLALLLHRNLNKNNYL